MMFGGLNGRAEGIAKNVVLPSYIRNTLLALILLIGKVSFAQLSCHTQWFSDSTGCGISPGSVTPLTILVKETETTSSPITNRVWTLYHCGGGVSAQYNGVTFTSFTQTIDTPGCYCLAFWEKNSQGQVCSDTTCHIKVSPSPVVGASFSPFEGCLPFTTDIRCTSNTPTGTIDSFLVIFNGNHNSQFTETNCPNGPVPYVFPVGTQPGYVNATVEVTNSWGCSAHITYDSIAHLIPNPVASFTQDTANAECAGGALPVCFTADSTDPNLTYCWYVNGVRKKCSTISRTFCDTFPVCNCCYDIALSVHHPSGCFDSIVKHNDVCVSTKPIITWSPPTDTICLPSSPVTLTNTSPNISNLTWRLFGGNPLTNFPIVTAPSDVYNIADTGTYTLIVSGTFAPGCTRTDTAIVIHAFNTPASSFTANDTFFCKLPDTVSFTATPCAGCTYNWSGQFGNSTGQTFTAIDNSFGSKFVTLTTSYKYGGFTCSSQVTNQNAVVVKTVVPKITSTGYEGCLPECVVLQNATILTGFPPGVTISSACWSFPGSSIPGACQDSIQRCVTSVGCNSVQLTVTTSLGCVDSVILVDSLCADTPPANCAITASPLTMCFERDTVKFKITCQDSIGWININFGDAGPHSWTTFRQNSFTHIYQDTGQFIAMAVVYNDSCPSDTLRSDTITIYPPIAKFTDSLTCKSGDTIFFKNQAIGATSYFWKFCNGDTSDLPNPYIILPYCDTCNALLTVYNSRTGCSHHKSLSFRTACDSSSFTPDTPSTCINTHIIFTNTSINSNLAVTKFDWNYPTTGFSVSLGSPQQTQYTSPGIYTVAMQNTSDAGCIDTLFTTVKVCNLSAGFSFDTVCFPAPVCFKDTSHAFCNPTKWRWNFGDGFTDTVQNPCHVYQNPGSYIVKLSVYSGPCSDSVSIPLATSNIVNINYSIDTIVCPGNQLCATNNSTGNTPTYNWQAPGASPPSSTQAAPCFWYNTPGNYQIVYTLSSNNQCSIVDTINVHAFAPVAGGYMDTDFLACPTPFHISRFVDTSKYVNGIYSWNFGDGYGATQINTNHIYEHPGVFVVTLIVTDKQGCADTAIIDTMTVLGPFGSFVEAPLPGICACKDSMKYILSTYDATKLTLIYGCQTGFTQDTILNVGTQTNPSVFSFTIPYCIDSVCLPEVQYGDNNQCLVSDSLPIFYVDSPSIKFTFNNFGVCYSGTVCFHDSTKYHLLPSQSYTVSRLWDFGDGTTDTSANPCHFYSQPGGYQVKLYIHSNLGCYDSSATAVVVVPKYPVAGYYASDSIVCAHNSVCFYDTSTIYPLTHAWFRIWNFGDGSPVDTVYADSVCHAYAGGGFYRVTMCVYDSIGCSACDSSTLLKVINNPTANAGGNQTLCYGAVAQLHGSGGLSYQWLPPGLFANPDTASPSLQLYQDTNVELIVRDIYGCSDSAAVDLTVARVFAVFSTNPTVCRGDSLCAKDSSTYVTGHLVQWLYDFGDSTMLSGKNVCHGYTASGNYTIMHIVTDNFGCSDTVSRNVVVFPSPQASFTLSDSVICSNQPICFTNQSVSPTPVASWNWDFDDNTNSTDSNPPCHTYSAPFITPYLISLVVVDDNNCRDTAIRALTVHVKPQANFSFTPSCDGDSTPMSNISTPGSSPVGYCEWTFWLGAPSPVIDSDCFTSFLFPAGTHNVQLIVTDLNGCRDTIVKPVVTDSLSQLVIYPGDTTICLGSAVNYSVSGVFDQITWTPPKWLSDPNAPIVTINPLQSVTYQVSAVNGVCAAAGDTFTIQVIQPIPVVVTDSPQTIVLGLTSDLCATTEDQPIDSIVWSPDSTLDCTNCLCPVARPIQTTTYTATIYFSYNGVTCSNSASVTVNVITTCNGSLIFIPNTFTPNGDGRDDIFMIRGVAANARIKEFRVFDRWGRVVFESADGTLNDPTYGWNGEDMAGKKLNPDVYVYTYQIQCSDGNIVTGNGNVTLLR
jgi:gliding motility-associated-like protein